MNEIISPTINEISEQDIGENNYREIKPDGVVTTDECDEFWNDIFSETSEDDNVEAETFDEVLTEYFDDLRDKSEFPDTIPDKPFDVADLKPCSPEKNAEMREDFDNRKADLKRQWEEEYGRPWPKYDHDVYSSTGKLIRKSGSDYDAHHIQPLGMGGKNEASNITPLSAENHYDKQGVHSPNSPYSRMDKMLGGSGNG